jgi:thiol-disulfide isomerase/thioredoxin
MAVLIGAIIIVGALCLLDLLLTFGVIRRLREHTEMLAQRDRHRDQPGAEDTIGLAAGAAPEDFTATDSAGAAVRGPSGLSVVAFFSTSCPVCPERAPVFIDYVRQHRVGRAEVLAVVIGQGAESVPYLAGLTEVARVCAESPGGSIGQAFALRGVPAFFVLDAGRTVLWSGYDPAALPAPAAV